MQEPFVQTSFSRVLSVTALTDRIKGRLETDFPDVWVEGEVSGVKHHTSGHCYFTLKDAGAQISCTLWRSSVARLRFRLENGMQVLIRGSINVYPPRGTYSLNARQIEPKGVGDLQLAFEQLKARLFAEGLFDEARKRPLPYLATRIGIVTSKTGAALQDLLNIIFRRFPNTTVVLCPARVQGEGAAQEIVRAIRNLNRYGDVDIIIVGRGGGSMEDLWCFNEEIVARAIAASTIPVVSAVGHEVDYTIADFVADLRAPTPSAAAELVTRNKAELQEFLNYTNQRLERAVLARLQSRRVELLALTERLRDPRSRLEDQRRQLGVLNERLSATMLRSLRTRRRALEALTGKLALVSPARQLRQHRARVERLTELLRRNAVRQLNARQRQRDILAGKLDALSPLGILGRGYAIAQRKTDNKVIVSSQEVAIGEEIKVRLREGTLDCAVVGR